MKLVCLFLISIVHLNYLYADEPVAIISKTRGKVKYKLNTENKQYKSSNYYDYITYKKRDVLESLQEKIDEFGPDIIFWSAFSSHIHGEGEYVNIQYG